MGTRAVLFGVIGAGLGAVAPGPVVRADFTTTQQTATIVSTQTNWGPGTIGMTGTNPVVIHQFDHTQYDTPTQDAFLKAVVVTLNYNFANEIAIRFDTTSTNSVTANGVIHVYLPDGKTNLVAPGTFTDPVTVTSGRVNGAPHWVFVPGPNEFKNFAGVSTSPAGGYTDPNIRQQFNGSGTIALPIYASASSNFTSNSGNGFGSSVTQATATLSVYYIYNFVPHISTPEPSSLVLTGLGGLGAVLACRGRARRGDSPAGGASVL